MLSSDYEASNRLMRFRVRYYCTWRYSLRETVICARLAHMAASRIWRCSNSCAKRENGRDNAAGITRLGVTYVIRYSGRSAGLTSHRAD